MIRMDFSMRTRLETAEEQGLYRRFSARIVLSAALAALTLFFSVAGLAQSTFGSFVGTVRDPSGAVVANCTVSVLNTGTSARRTTTTDQNGSYVLVNLEPGNYEISMEASGFQRASFTNLALAARQTVRVDGNMILGTQAQTVSVQETAPVINTDSSSLAETKTGRELNDLPVAIGSRAAGSTSPITTLTTQPGVQTDNAGNISVSGAKPSMLSTSIDGISTMSVRSSAPVAELFPSFSAIAEIRVSEVNNSAEFGGISDITTISRGALTRFTAGYSKIIRPLPMMLRRPSHSQSPSW